MSLLDIGIIVVYLITMVGIGIYFQRSASQGIGAGLLIPLLIRWYWWRFNGYGFSIGILTGMAAAVVQRIIFPEIPEYLAFATVSGLSLIGTFAGTMFFKATSQAVLLNFYKITRPFGFWRPVAMAIPAGEQTGIRRETIRDRVSTLYAVIWQLALFLTMMSMVMKRWDYTTILGIVFAVMSLLLYFNWFRYLKAE